MSTTYSATTKDASATKDKDSTETSTYARDATVESGKTGKGSNKTATFESSDKTSQDKDNNESSTFNKQGNQFGQQQSRGQQWGQDGQQSRGQQQWGQDSDVQSSRHQSEIQQKLKEVGNLLQKAGHLLQDLQGSSGDFQCSANFSRGHGGNYQGPYGGFESQSTGYGQQSYGSQYGASGQYRGGDFSGRFESERPQYSRYEDREERPFGQSRGFSSRPEERFEGRVERQNTDRFGGFGGPNRPDLAYGEQYGVRNVSYGTEGRDQGRPTADHEFSLGNSSRRGGNVPRW